jgi:hypothetical protein
MLGLDQVQKATQALPVDVDVSLHGTPRRRQWVARFRAVSVALIQPFVVGRHRSMA